MILLVKSDTAILELYLARVTEVIATSSTELGRAMAKNLPKKIEEFLSNNNCQYSDLAGLAIYSGPGSFTGLRISHTFLNACAYSLNIPIVGATGENWINESLQKLQDGVDDRIALPLYGSEAHITLPKK